MTEHRRKDRTDVYIKFKMSIHDERKTVLINLRNFEIRVGAIRFQMFDDSVLLWSNFEVFGVFLAKTWIFHRVIYFFYVGLGCNSWLI